MRQRVSQSSRKPWDEKVTLDYQLIKTFLEMFLKNFFAEKKFQNHLEFLKLDLSPGPHIAFNRGK